MATTAEGNTRRRVVYRVADVAGALQTTDPDMSLIYGLAVSSRSADELRRKAQAADSTRPGLARKVAKLLEPLESDE